LVAFRVAGKDVEFFKQMAEDHYRRGDIKTPTIAALGKWNLYWTCKMLKDLEKVRILTDQERSHSFGEPEVEDTKISDYDDRYNDDRYSTDGKGDYNDDGRWIKRPFFYEIWQKYKQL